ncbi:EF-P 5-aminopentanol modification-associated protein YfmF [Secundilactobacillus folii]|uniref:Insulinase family protein n=1 Tax=Secundilactobacillus folii TaxID=2678357 RepID=A0A7X3C3W0_9LACO|nr:pitrilysin family protein [Secundilactobacillus folii]MTV82996.1 insulinase family protein [Secundilactobacillus folii]
MPKQLAKGVWLNVMPTTQFKTISMTVDFLVPGSAPELSNRILLAQLLETSSAQYPTQTAMAEKLSMMYGASFGVNVFRYGKAEGLRFSSTIINDHFIGGHSLLNEMIDFMQSVIYQPLVKDRAFDPETFNRQKQNLIAYLRSLNDDKQYYAEQQLNALYFKGQPFFATSLYGDEASILGINGSDLYRDYQTLLAHDQIQITVAGDVDEKAVAFALSKWGLTDRQEQIENPIFQRPVTAVETATESQKLQQSKLNLAYRLPVYYRDERFYQALVFNGLFGGTPISMLFKNVREKNSLAYYASSRFDGFTGTLLVQAGIDQSKEAVVKQLIDEQLVAISKGEFSDEVFNQVVASLINARESRLDSQRALVNHSMLDHLVRQTVSAKEWVAKVKQVTPAEVAAIARQVRLQAVYFLKGEDLK